MASINGMKIAITEDEADRLTVAGAVDGRHCEPVVGGQAPAQRHQVVRPLVTGSAMAEKDQRPGATAVGREPKDAGYRPPAGVDGEITLADALDVDPVLPAHHLDPR